MSTPQRAWQRRWPSEEWRALQWRSISRPWLCSPNSGEQTSTLHTWNTRGATIQRRLDTIPLRVMPTRRMETNSYTSECRCCEWAGSKRRRMQSTRRCWRAPKEKTITWGSEWSCAERGNWMRQGRKSPESWPLIRKTRRRDHFSTKCRDRLRPVAGKPRGDYPLRQVELMSSNDFKIISIINKNIMIGVVNIAILVPGGPDAIPPSVEGCSE